MRQRLVTVALLACYASACTSWRVQQLSPQRVLAEKRPTRMFVERRTGSAVILETPAIRSDSLVGWDPNGLHNVSIALRDITRIEIREHDSTKTVYATIGIVAGVAAVAFLGLLAIVAGDDS